MISLRWKCFFSTLKFGIDGLATKSYNGGFVVEPEQNMQLTSPLNSQHVFKLNNIYKYGNDQPESNFPRLFSIGDRCFTYVIRGH